MKRLDLIGKTKQEIKNVLGTPDKIAIGSKKYKEPVFSYNGIEYHFYKDRCWLIFDNNLHLTLAIKTCG